MAGVSSSLLHRSFFELRRNRWSQSRRRFEVRTANQNPRCAVLIGLTFELVPNLIRRIRSLPSPFNGPEQLLLLPTVIRILFYYYVIPWRSVAKNLEMRQAFFANKKFINIVTIRSGRRALSAATRNFSFVIRKMAIFTVTFRPSFRAHCAEFPRYGPVERQCAFKNARVALTDEAPVFAMVCNPLAHNPSE